MGAGLAEQFFVNKKLDWWKNCLLTRSWNDEGILCLLEAGSMKEFLLK